MLGANLVSQNHGFARKFADSLAGLFHGGRAVCALVGFAGLDTIKNSANLDF